MGVSDRSLVSPSSMRAFIVCLAIASVSGDAKPYTVKQVAEGLPVKNAIADRRLHNVGVITNAAEAGVTKVGAVPVGVTYAATHVVYSHTAYPYPLHYLGKRGAEPYTLGQVAAGQTAGGEITAIDFGHGTGLQPAKAATHVVAVNPVVYARAAYPYYNHLVGGVHLG